MSSIGDRLRDERERLGLTQPELADRCGITMRSQRNYEKGERSPDAEYLAAIEALGFDVLFVLTGKRDRAPAPAITADERRLLERYAAADETGRKMAHRVLNPDPDQAAVKKVGSRGRNAA